MFPESDSALAKFAENLPGAAFYYAAYADGREGIQFLNSGCERIWGVTAEQLDGDPAQLWEMVPTENLAAVEKSITESATQLSLWETEFTITDGSGRRRTLLGRGTPERLTCGGTRWLTFLLDITAMTRTKELFEIVTKQLHYISDAIPDGFALFDKSEKLVVCNAGFRDMYGLPDDAGLSGLTYGQILEKAVDGHRAPEADGSEQAWVEDALTRFRSADDRYEIPWLGARWFRILDRPTEDGGRVAFRIEVTDAVKRKKDLERAAFTDPVTGLLNRRGLSEEVARHVSKTGIETLAVMHIDLDKFKAINDVYGHEAGDLVLKVVADRARQRSGEAAIVARVGGDEFVTVFPHNGDASAACEISDALRNLIVEPIKCKDQTCQVGATIGLALWNGDGQDSLEQILCDADTALTWGKSRGRNQTVLFTPAMRDRTMQRASLADRIKAGIRAGAFKPYFQPQVRMPDRAVIGLEALARWRKPDGTVTTAGDFIDVATDTGLIADIEGMVLRGSLDMLRKLQENGICDVAISINLSGMQLSQSGLVEGLLDELMQRGLHPRQVNLEVLETTLLDDRADQIGKNIFALAEAGFRIELDDFGTGHTALTSLTTFPVHQIKVDRSLIQGIDTAKKKRAVSAGLFLVCDKLGIDAIAEGVETTAELDVLQDIGFTRFQGYYFSKPQAADAAIEWIQQWQSEGCASQSA